MLTLVQADTTAATLATVPQPGAAPSASRAGAQLLARLREHGDAPALALDRGSVSYRELVDRVAGWVAELDRLGIAPGAAVAIRADFAVEPCALLLAVIASGRIAVPLGATSSELPAERLTQARASAVFEFSGGSLVRQERLRASSHPLYDRLAAAGAPGLVLFTSGSSGRRKASLLDLDRLLARVGAGKACHRTVGFLLFDHIGGLNTFFHTMASGGLLVPVAERSPAVVCAAIERHRAELLPTTPTFLKMLLVSGAWREHDLSSLKLITYGAEPMPASTLAAVRAALPEVRLKQTYGMSELGILPTRSRDSESLWLKAGGPGYETKVLDGRLFVRAESAMLGYLDDPSPIRADGWLDTGDAVEVDGEWIRILGRVSECINVGGEKVYPAEVEAVLLGLENVADAVVSGRPNPITGQVVSARLVLSAPEDEARLRVRVRRACKERLASYKVPAVVEVVTGPLHSDRYKKERVAAR